MLHPSIYSEMQYTETLCPENCGHRSGDFGNAHIGDKANT